MAEADIPVDLFNPGQVFACLGFVEAADVLLGEATGTFDWSDARDVRFRMAARGSRSPIEVVIEFLRSASATALAPHGSEHSATKWTVETVHLSAEAGYPYPEPDSPAPLPVRLDGYIEHEQQSRAASLTIDYWGDSYQATGRDSFKLWGGAGGYPGAALARDTLEIIRGGEITGADPFAFAAPQSSSFRLDWRRDYIPIDAGFSPNKHTDVSMVGYPMVELLAALGLTYSRPKRDERLSYRYTVISGASLDPTFLRAALSGAELPFSQRCFRLDLGWTGQEGKERCITTVTEENKR